MKTSTLAKLTIVISSILLSLPTWALTISEDSIPEIYYSSPQKYTIQDITVTGIKHYEANLLVNISGLEIGQQISIPGEEVTNAIKKFWRHGLFSDVKITATKRVGQKIWLNIDLKERPRLSMINYHGMKKGETEDIEDAISMIKGSQVTPNLINRTSQIIAAHFVEKGFHNVEVDIVQRDDAANENQLIIDIYVDKKEKVKVANMYIAGNEVLSYKKINRAMKKTNDKRLINIFRTKKFIDDEFVNDKKALLAKYNELGYRDAILISDSITAGEEENTVNVHLSIEEGHKYYFGDFNWVGNTKFPSDQLEFQMRINTGDVYNQALLSTRLETDEDAVGSLYSDNGYLFYNLTPVEIAIVDDSIINLEMRIMEGPQATLNNVGISGNSKTNENVARRELRVKPGQLFNKSALMRSVRELSQLGHFDPETLGQNLEVIPNAEDATVDLIFNVDEKANDQIELSGGWGAGMFVGTLGLTFNNFSIQNFFDKESWKPLPSGDGQSLSLKAQTNGKYYQNYSISFREPWLGGKRPNSLSVSAYHSIQTGVSDSYGYYGTGSSYGSSYGNTSSSYGADMYDDSKHLNVTGVSVGIGKRLSWPDDYFTLYNEISYQHYDILNWYFLGFETGKSNILSFTSTISRSSIDNPIYTRRGSTFSASVQFTPPYSLFNDVDYNSPNTTDAEKYQFIEYHKWKFKAQSFAPLSNDAKLVLMSRAEYGFLGYYTEAAKSPFERFNLGGDGLSGYNLYGSETIGLRGYENGALTYYDESGESAGNLYTRLTMELRYPLMLETSSTIYALAFVEAGRTWGDFRDFNPFELKRSAGAGVRIFLPMFGMMGIDWGYGFDEAEASGSGGSQFHFIIGQQF